MWEIGWNFLFCRTYQCKNHTIKCIVKHQFSYISLQIANGHQMFWHLKIRIREERNITTWKWENVHTQKWMYGKVFWQQKKKKNVNGCGGLMLDAFFFALDFFIFQESEKKVSLLLLLRCFVLSFTTKKRNRKLFERFWMDLLEIRFKIKQRLICKSILKHWPNFKSILKQRHNFEPIMKQWLNLKSILEAVI